MSDLDTFGLEIIGQIAVPVSNIDRTIAFYRDLESNLLALMSAVR